MQNIIETNESDLEATVTKIATDIQDFVADTGDVDIEDDLITIVTDELQVDVKVELFETDLDGEIVDEIDLTIDQYHLYANTEDHTTLTFNTTQEAIEHLKTLV